MGRGCILKPSFIHRDYFDFLRLVPSPTSVGFMARAAGVNLSGCRARQKPPSKGTEEGDVKPFYVYVDEFQNFITPTIAKNLDQVRQ
jgi:hypothetical protein